MTRGNRVHFLKQYFLQVTSKPKWITFLENTVFTKLTLMQTESLSRTMANGYKRNTCTATIPAIIPGAMKPKGGKRVYGAFHRMYIPRITFPKITSFTGSKLVVKGTEKAKTKICSVG